MEDATNDNRRLRRRRRRCDRNEAKTGEDDDGREEQQNEEGSKDDEECDKEVWDTLSASFKQVQSVLDQNRTLIQQVNENHESKLPDNLAKNVSLIREINGNISKVMSLYSDLSANFSSIVHQRRAVTASNTNHDETEKNNSLNTESIQTKTAGLLIMLAARRLD
nr:early flowering 4-like 5A [Diospyros sp. 'deyangshi']WCL15318.1 early flowering 4-like 5B [Diospyros sp. 'deyangshi']